MKDALELRLRWKKNNTYTPNRMGWIAKNRYVLKILHGLSKQSADDPDDPKKIRIRAAIPTVP